MAYSATASSSRAQLAYIAETTPGTTPETPHLRNLRMTGESLNAARTTSVSAEIRADRNTPDLITTAETSTGNINFEFSYGEYDDFLEAVLQGTWTSNVLKNGVVRRSFTIEKQFSDVTGKFVRFTGAELTAWNLNLAAGAYLTGDFGIMARGSASATTALDATPAASLTNPVYNLTQNVTGLTIGGTAYGDGIQNFTLAYNNAPREQRQIGSKNLAGIGMGTITLTGSMTVYVGSATAINTAFDNDTPVAVSFTAATSVGGSYVVTLPAIKFSSRTIVAGAKDQDVVMALNWTATYDATSACMIQITRAVAP